MHSFFFGERRRQLYGVYHPAAGFGLRAAVICAPWGHEYLQGHRTLRRLADLLAQSGIHALRFDYGGTGDSSGSTAETTLGSMALDVQTAVDEAMALSGTSDCLLIGLRLGANAAQRSCPGLPEIRGTVLWDPILDGRRYLRDLGGAERRYPGGSVDIGGYDVSAAMVEELEGLTLDDASSAPGQAPHHVFLAEAEAAGPCQRQGWSVETYTEAMPWRERSDFGSTPVPAKTLDAMVEIACEP